MLLHNFDINVCFLFNWSIKLIFGFSKDKIEGKVVFKTKIIIMSNNENFEPHENNKKINNVSETEQTSSSNKENTEHISSDYTTDEISNNFLSRNLFISGGSNQNRTVTFNANGGSPNPANRTVANGSQIGTLPNVTRANHTFSGWWTSQTGGSQVSNNTVINSNMNLVARWNQQVTNRTVTFNANGGSPNPANRTVANGNRIGTLPNVIRVNHTFSGWWTAVAWGFSS